MIVGAGSLASSIAAVRLGGTVHAIGYAAGEQVKFDMFDAIRHAVTLRVGSAGNRRDFEALVRATTQHRLRPAIDRRFPVFAFREAFDYLERGGHFGKVVLTFS
jgi:threonine dehydrogenase-like Zn-dependent dehydrogenase